MCGRVPPVDLCYVETGETSVMHTTLQTALNSTLRGDSVSALVVFADVRGFSTFCRAHDSAEVALYVSKLFQKMIARYSGFSGADFFKSTGDGLLMVFPYLDGNFEELYKSVVIACLEIHDTFPDLLSDVRAINFKPPTAIGFSIVRGAISALTAVDDQQVRFVVDYAGHRINLGARLQDLARPSGVILEGGRDIELLDAEIQERFLRQDAIFVRSIAPTTPISIWCLEGI